MLVIKQDDEHELTVNILGDHSEKLFFYNTINSFSQLESTLFFFFLKKNASRQRRASPTTFILFLFRIFLLHYRPSDVTAKIMA